MREIHLPYHGNRSKSENKNDVHDGRWRIPVLCYVHKSSRSCIVTLECCQTLLHSPQNEWKWIRKEEWYGHQRWKNGNELVMCKFLCYSYYLWSWKANLWEFYNSLWDFHGFIGFIENNNVEGVRIFYALTYRFFQVKVKVTRGGFSTV